MLTTIEKVLFLQEVPFLESVSTEALAHLASVATEEDAPAGRDLWQPEDPADSVYFIVEGEVGVGEEILARRGPRCQFGSSSLLGRGGVRATTATVLRDASLLRVTRDDFFEVLDEHPELARALLGAIPSSLSGRPVQEAAND